MGPEPGRGITDVDGAVAVTGEIYPESAARAHVDVHVPAPRVVAAAEVREPAAVLEHGAVGHARDGDIRGVPYLVVGAELARIDGSSIARQEIETLCTEVLLHLDEDA